MNSAAYTGPDALSLADWRRRINDLYSMVRSTRDPHEAWQVWIDVRSAMFRDHPQSPLPADARAQFGKIPAFNYDPAWRFDVGAVPVDGEPVDYDLAGDGAIKARPIARTSGLEGRLGRELTLFWIEGYGGGVFLPFSDASPKTYGAGRYLLDAIKGADLGLNGDRLILDFNFAYNPSCAWNAEFDCPLAPRENALSVAVEAGEKAPVTQVTGA